MTVVAINKTASPQTMHLQVVGFRGKQVRSFVVTDGAYDTPNPGDVQLSAQGIEVTAPPFSIVTSEIMER